MANLPEVDRLEEEVFDFVRKAEESALQASRNWAKAVNEFVPMEMPVVHKLGKGVFDFTENVLKVQREFAQNVLKTTRLAMMRVAETSPKPTTRTTKATHAPRATTKTTRARKVA